MKDTRARSQFQLILGYLAIPHELLHVLGHRLVGQRCKYQWGNTYVTPIGEITRWKRLVGLLFPFVVFFSLTIIFSLPAGFASRSVVQEGQVFWFVFWLGLTYIAGFYTSSTIGDLRQAYLLLKNKPWYAWTPFDIFYQPLMDWNEIRRKVAEGEIDAEQD
jgi:hypothetical protein